MMPEAVIELEAGIDLKNLDTAMIKYGYTPIVTDLTSGLHLIHIKNGVLYGTADPRREGVALGE
jgi:gamma-glutamyltranspeptidase/glutathione hydrolase